MTQIPDKPPAGISATADSGAGAPEIAGGDELLDIPSVPPPGILPRYLSLSWRYVYWCFGMLAWAILCIVYFILTRQYVEMGIGIGIGVLLIAMIAMPTVLFGGETWYKRLAWMTMLLCLFSVMYIYPLIAVALGIAQRIRTHRYRQWLYTDIWHLALCALTVVVAVWTILLTCRAVSLARRLYKGEMGVVDIRRR